MKFTRKLNVLNRVVLPKQGVEALGWGKGTRVNIVIENQKVIVTADRPVCCICGKGTVKLVEVEEKSVCEPCIQKAAEKIGQRRVEV